MNQARAEHRAGRPQGGGSALQQRQGEETRLYTVTPLNSVRLRVLLHTAKRRQNTLRRACCDKSEETFHTGSVAHLFTLESQPDVGLSKPNIRGGGGGCTMNDRKENMSAQKKGTTSRKDKGRGREAHTLECTK